MSELMTVLRVLFALFLLPSIEAWTISSQLRSGLSSRLALMAGKNDKESNNNVFDMSELARRIETLRESEEHAEERFRQLPVVSFDALLPGQKLEGTTSDSNFIRLLQALGLGGQFCMTSINQSKRMIRRNGSLCRIEIMDAKSVTEREPTGVDFVIVGMQRCRIVGPPEKMKLRMGRWRRVYDPNGEEVVMGWGEERFVDALSQCSAYDMEGFPTNETSQSLNANQWSSCLVDCQPMNDEDSNNDEVTEMIDTILPLLEEWETLAADVNTYQNTDVVVAARVMVGQPGLRVDPAALMRQVKMNLGDMPSDATGIALWGAALMNPLPALGVSPEIRGRVLEATTAKQRLQILEWGLKKSIDNLKGTAPL